VINISFTNFELDLTKINEKPRLYVCRPDKTTIGILLSYFGLKWNPKISQISQLDFSIFTDIEINHKLVRNNNFDLLKYKYLIRYEYMNYIEYFVINTIEDSSDQDSFIKNINCYSLAFNLTDEIITYSNTDTDYSKNGTQILEILLDNTVWTVGSVSSDIDLKYLQFNFSSKTCLDCLYEAATSFSALLQFDTINYTVSLSNDLTSIENIENIANSSNYGLVLDYGKYIDTLSFRPNSDSFCTHLKVFGQNGLTINSVNITGGAELTNYQFFMFPFTRDNEGNILQHSYYMSDNLCIAIEEYNSKIFTYEGQFETLTTNKISLQETLNTSSTDLVDLKAEMNVILDALTIVQTNNQDTSTLITNRNNKQIEIDNKLKEINSILTYFTITNPCTINGNINLTIDDKSINIALLATDDINNIALKISNYINNNHYNTDNKFPLNPIFKCSASENIISIVYFSTKDEADIDIIYTDTDNTGMILTIGNKTNFGLENQISNINNQMLVINNELSEENNFTSEQLFELKASYVKKKEIRNEFISNPKILLDFARNEFKKYYSIPISLEISLINLFNCLNVGSQIDRQFIRLGEIIRIIYPIFNIDVKCIITEITYSQDDSNINLTISNISDISKDIDKYLKLFNQSISTSTTVETSKSNWNSINSTNNSVMNIIETLQGKYTGELNLAGNEYCSLDRKGLTATDPNDNKRIVRVTHGAIGLSKSGGDSFETCISADGVISEKLIGKILLGNSLTLDASDAEGNKIMTVNTEGVSILNLILSLLRSDNKTRILLDPTVGFKIQKNTGSTETPVWSDIFYINNDGDLVTKGNIEIGSGTNSVFHANENGIYLGSDSFEDAPFRIDLSGNMVSNNADFTGSLKIQGTDILDTIDNVKTINGQYLSSNSIGSSKIIDLNADKISAGTITGSTIKTGEDDNTRVELKSNWADIDIYHSLLKLLTIYDGGNYTNIYSPSNKPIIIGNNGYTGVISAEGDWDFTGANVTGIVAKFM